MQSTEQTEQQTPTQAPGLLAEGRTLGVIGAGVMGQTLLRGLLQSGLVQHRNVWTTAKSEETCKRVAASLGIAAERDYRARIADAGILLLCVKPSQMGVVLTKLKQAGLPEDVLLISIAAGDTIAQLEGMLGTANPWIRAMPNTPCIVGEGMTVVCGGTEAREEHLATARRIFQAVGLCRVVDETYFNAITALSGSGPAYIYLIIEALADAGVRVGLPRELALSLVSQTVMGATKMVQASGRHPASLRDDVTTPAGCTIAGLLMLEDGKIRSVLARAIEEATRTAGQLGQPKAGNSH
ncbi:MAG: pyrroline-5-carboxylate reductase [Bryobacterales bacterium]|jgi:pyrroline-5-carboxylate reductase|nr:pyrroline-5-carboxylate reductase [Bryobacterales bacterium]